MKRLIALLVAIMLAVSLLLSFNSMDKGHSTEGLYYTVTDIHPDAELIRVNDTDVTAEEYLYWLAYDCEYLSSYSADLDWNEEVSDGMTYAQYAKTDALETVKLYSIVRQWAKKGNITLSEENKALLDQQRQEYVSYYGSEAAFSQQIRLLGISDEAFDEINTAYYLYAQVRQAFADTKSSLYPGADVLDAFAEEQGYSTVKLLYLSTVGLENEDAIASKKSAIADYAQQLQESEDRDTLYAQFAEELGLEYPEGGLTVSAEDLADAPELADAIQSLKAGQVSDVVTCDTGFYVVIREALNVEDVAGYYFDQQLTAAQAAAEVKFNETLYDSIDASTFYPALLEARSALQEELGAADTEDSAQSSVPSSGSITLPKN